MTFANCHMTFRKKSYDIHKAVWNATFGRANTNTVQKDLFVDGQSNCLDECATVEKRCCKDKSGKDEKPPEAAHSRNLAHA